MSAAPNHPDRENDGYKPPARKISQRERERLERQHASWIWFIIKCAFFGAALGVIASWLFIEANLNGFGELIARSPNRVGFTALLTLSFASTFGTIAMGVGIMFRSSMMGDDE